MALNALTALIGHARAGRVRWPCASLFAVVGAFGAWGGSSLAKIIDGQQLLLFFAIAMAAVGLSMLRPKPENGGPDVRLTRALVPRVGVTAAGVGTAAGFFGIGGGFLIVPGMMAAQASSLLSVAAFGATTSFNYALSGWVDLPLVAAMTVGGVAGTLLGLPISHRLGQNAALGRRLFAGLILIVAVYVAIKAISALL